MLSFEFTIENEWVVAGAHLTLECWHCPSLPGGSPLGTRAAKVIGG
eukprot:SAG31_NODE_24581_length_478_cov_1.153034_1_plen_45_part_10